MFDITKDVVLPKKWKRRYRIIQVTILLTFFLFASYASHQILFPPRILNFNSNPASIKKNTMAEPKIASGASFEQGKIPLNDKLLFNADAVGEFSDISLEINVDPKSQSLENDTVFVRKSYEAYLYPEGDTIGFNDGSLLTSNGNYFIVSNGRLRKFSSIQLMQKMGFRKDAFLNVTESELKANEPGDEIVEEKYPDDSLFKIENNYYKLSNDTIEMFVSEKAFLTQFEANQAIEKNQEFLNKYLLSENFLGFAPGSLLSSPISVFIVSESGLLPVNNPTTFLAHGYRWEDVLPSDTDEVGLYNEEYLFTIDKPHPDGTLFKEKETGKIYLIRNEKKHRIISPLAASSYSKKEPLLVDERSLTQNTSCVIKKKFLLPQTYSCSISIQDLEYLIGEYYQFELKPEKKIQIDNINVIFTKKIILSNAKQSLSDIRNQIIQRYSQL